MTATDPEPPVSIPYPDAPQKEGILKRETYRQAIDRLVAECRDGQGQIGPIRARKGIWNENARSDFLPDQHKINELLSDLSDSQREILAGMLEDQFSRGVFESLKVLEDLKIEPFLDGYEGSPYHDFVGRLDDWEWPEK